MYFWKKKKIQFRVNISLIQLVLFFPKMDIWQIGLKQKWDFYRNCTFCDISRPVYLKRRQKQMTVYYESKSTPGSI